MSKSYIHVFVLFHTGLYAYNSTYLVLTYHQSIHWNWHQSGERHGNKKHKVIQCSILMLSSMNHTKHTAIKNSVTMLMSQFHDQNFTKLSSIQSECTPCSQCKGKVKTWCVYELFCVMSVRRGSSGYITQEAAVHETSAGHNGMEHMASGQHFYPPRHSAVHHFTVDKCGLKIYVTSVNQVSNLRRNISIYGVFDCVVFTIAKLKIRNCYYNATTTTKTLRKDLFLTLITSPSNWCLWIWQVSYLFSIDLVDVNIGNAFLTAPHHLGL